MKFAVFATLLVLAFAGCIDAAIDSDSATSDLKNHAEGKMSKPVPVAYAGFGVWGELPEDLDEESRAELEAELESEDDEFHTKRIFRSAMRGSVRDEAVYPIWFGAFVGARMGLINAVDTDGAFEVFSERWRIGEVNYNESDMAKVMSIDALYDIAKTQEGWPGEVESGASGFFILRAPEYPMAIFMRAEIVNKYIVGLIVELNATNGQVEGTEYFSESLDFEDPTTQYDPETGLEYVLETYSETVRIEGNKIGAVVPRDSMKSITVGDGVDGPVFVEYRYSTTGSTAERVQVTGPTGEVILDRTGGLIASNSYNGTALAEGEPGDFVLSIGDTPVSIESEIEMTLTWQERVPVEDAGTANTGGSMSTSATPFAKIFQKLPFPL